jgi:hypothetical protein
MKQRFLSVYLRHDASEHLGTGADRQCFHYYANVKNVIRYGLAHPNFPPGQYHIYAWPEGTVCPETPIMTAYKRV